MSYPLDPWRNYKWYSQLAKLTIPPFQTHPSLPLLNDRTDQQEVHVSNLNYQQMFPCQYIYVCFISIFTLYNFSLLNHWSSLPWTRASSRFKSSLKRKKTLIILVFKKLCLFEIKTHHIERLEIFFWFLSKKIENLMKND